MELAWGYVLSPPARGQGAPLPVPFGGTGTCPLRGGRGPVPFGGAGTCLEWGWYSGTRGTDMACQSAPIDAMVMEAFHRFDDGVGRRSVEGRAPGSGGGEGGGE